MSVMVLPGMSGRWPPAHGATEIGVDMPTYAFFRIEHGDKRWGVVSGDTPEAAMARVLGSHPEAHGVTYANVYLPDGEANHEWFMHPPRRPQDHRAMR